MPAPVLNRICKFEGWGLCFAAVLIAGCFDFPPPSQARDASVIDASDGNRSTCVDEDHDGYFVGCETQLPSDCSDALAERNPGALEICDNGIDENCDGVDLACDDALVPNQVGVDGGYRVTNGSVELLFDEQQGMLISELRRVGASLNLLHTTGDMPEKYIGLEIWRRAFQWQDATPTATVLASGPAVFQLHVQSSDGVSVATKNGERHELETDSIYTVFPDGRIHRDESATVFETFGQNVSAFLSLDPSLFDHVRSSYQSGGGVPVPETGNVNLQNRPYSPGPNWACAHTEGDAGPSHMIGMLHHVQNENTPKGPRVTHSQENTKADRALSIIFDWRKGGNIDSVTYLGDFLIFAGEPEGEIAPCQEMERMSDWLYSKRALVSFSNPETDPFPKASNSQSFDVGGGFWNLQSKNPRFLRTHLQTDSTHSPAPRPAFRIEGLALVDGVLPYIELGDEALVHGLDYLWQVEDLNTIAWLYLERELSDDTPLTIRLPAAIGP